MSWWSARSPRERLLLAIMFALLALVAGWLLIVRPLADSLEAAKARHAAAAIALAEARAQPMAGPAPALPGPVDAIAARTAAEAGFPGARVTSQGPGRATVAIDAARPQALFGWVARLEAGGLIVERLRAQANADRTLSAELVLRAGQR
jgi:general secretion pathway protein M